MHPQRTGSYRKRSQTVFQAIVWERSVLWKSIRQDVPHDFAINHLTGSFADAVKWWIGDRMKMSPEGVADNYLKLIGYPKESMV